MGSARWTYWLIGVLGILALSDGLSSGALQTHPPAEKPLVAIPYFVHGAEAIKNLVEGCTKNRPELAPSLRAGVSLTASLGRFCDKDSPFEAIVHNAKPTEREMSLLSRVVPAGNVQPQQIFLGQRRLIAVVHPSNPVKFLDLSQLQEMLKKGGAASAWNKVGGGATPINVYDQGPKSWARYILKMRCMAFERPAGGGIMKGWYDFREGVKEVLDFEAAVAQVKKDPSAICFVAYQGQPLKGVSVLSIKGPADGVAVSPELKPTIQGDYPLAEPLFLWLHPKASDTTRSFAQFASSENAARILERYGFITPWMQRQYEAELRLADARAGKGVCLMAIGVEQGKPTMPDLATEYVRAKAVIQLPYAAVDSDVSAIGAFVAGGAGMRELLLLSDKPSSRAMQLYGKQWNALGSTSLTTSGRDANGGSTHSAGSGQASLTTGQPNGTGPAEYLLAGRAAAVIVNPANKIDALTIGQLQVIFGGEVADWGTLGSTGLTTRGNSKSQIKESQIKESQSKGSQIAKSEIKAIGLRADDLATGIFEKECIERAKWKRVAIKKDSAEVLAAVSMDPQAIGFVDLAGIPATGQNVRILGIRLGAPPPPAGAGPSPRGRGVAEGAGAAFPSPARGGGVYYPTPENLRSAMYPLSQRLWLYVHPQASDTAKDFVKFIATCGASEASPYADTVKAVMDTYRKNGLVPLADAALLRMTKDAMAAAAARAKAEAEAKAGRGKKKGSSR